MCDRPVLWNLDKRVSQVNYKTIKVLPIHTAIDTTTNKTVIQLSWIIKDNIVSLLIVEGKSRDDSDVCTVVLVLSGVSVGPNIQ